jgi:hypothetical protein
MKIRHLGLLAIACIFTFASCATTATTAAPGFDASRFPRWIEEEGIWRTVVNKSFKDGSQNAPTAAQIDEIIQLAIKAPTSGGTNDFFLLILTDPAQQQDVVGQGNASDGTITVLVFTDRALTNHPRNITLAQDRGYTNAGIVSGYVNLAAISQGFGTHLFLTPSGYYGNRPLIADYVTTESKPPIEDVYLKDKGYLYKYGSGENASTTTYDPYGSLKFVLAIVIGTLDDTADTQLTDHGYPANWAYAK